jgi:hypothetical protein
LDNEVQNIAKKFKQRQNQGEQDHEDINVQIEQPSSGDYTKEEKQMFEERSLFEG